MTSTIYSFTFALRFRFEQIHFRNYSCMQSFGEDWELIMLMSMSWLFSGTLFLLRFHNFHYCWIWSDLKFTIWTNSSIFQRNVERMCDLKSFGLTGDISAVNTTERVRLLFYFYSLYYLKCSIMFQVFCVFLFLTGVSLFGTLISQTNSIILTLSRDSLDLACHLERYTSFMKHYRQVLALWNNNNHDASLYWNLCLSSLPKSQSVHNLFSLSISWFEQFLRVPRNLDQDVRNWVRFQHTIEGHERKVIKTWWKKMIRFLMFWLFICSAQKCFLMKSCLRFSAFLWQSLSKMIFSPRFFYSFIN